MQIDCTTTGRKLILHVPYDSVLGCEWTEDSVGIEVDIRSLLQVILPMACIKEESCCASRFATEEGRALLTERPALPPVAEPRLMTDRDIKDVEFSWEGDTLVPREALL